MDILTLSQTLVGDWVVTYPNPKKDFSETEVAFFSRNTVAPEPVSNVLREAVIVAFVAELSMRTRRVVHITSHDAEAKERMRARFLKRGTFLAVRHIRQERKTRRWFSSFSLPSCVSAMMTHDEAIRTYTCWPFHRLFGSWISLWVLKPVGEP